MPFEQAITEASRSPCFRATTPSASQPMVSLGSIRTASSSLARAAARSPAVSSFSASMTSFSASVGSKVWASSPGSR